MTRFAGLLRASKLESFELVVPPLKDWGAYKQRQLSEITSLMFHRIGPTLPFQGATGPTTDVPLTDAAGIARWFELNGQKEIGSPKMPYTFVIPQVGSRLYQAVPLKCVTPHALVWNRRAVSVAFIGDFRRTKPTPFQVEAAKWISLRVQDHIGRRLTLERHSLAAGGTDDPKGHECPGAKFKPAFDAIEGFVSDAFFVTE